MSIDFVYTQLNVKTVLYQTIQFSVSIQLSSISPIDRALSGAITSGPEWTWEWWQWRGTPHSPKSQHHWNLPIRLFSVIFRTLVGGDLPLCREAASVFYSPNRLGTCISITSHIYERERDVLNSFQELSYIYQGSNDQ